MKPGKRFILVGCDHECFCFYNVKELIAHIRQSLASSDKKTKDSPGCIWIDIQGNIFLIPRYLLKRCICRGHEIY